MANNIATRKRKGRRQRNHHRTKKSLYILPIAFGTALKAFTSHGNGERHGTERTLFPGIIIGPLPWVFEQERKSDCFLGSCVYLSRGELSRSLRRHGDAKEKVSTLVMLSCSVCLGLNWLFCSKILRNISLEQLHEDVTKVSVGTTLTLLS